MFIIKLIKYMYLLIHVDIDYQINTYDHKLVYNLKEKAYDYVKNYIIFRV